MTDAYVDKNYIYAVARVRAIENQLLTNQTFSEIMGVQNAQDILRILKEKGWGNENTNDIESILKAEREKLWSFIDEIVPDKSVFNIFKLTSDYHNLKAAIKESTMEYDYPGIYQNEGITDYKLIRDCIKNKEFNLLPKHLQDVAEEAYNVYIETADGQLSDTIVDEKAVEALGVESKTNMVLFLKKYAEIMAAVANIKIAIRCSLTGKDKEFMNRAIAECETLNKDLLINAALNGIDSICSYLQTTEYKDAVDEIKISLTSFERWSDNLMVGAMREQMYECFGLSPIAVYVLARENEIKNVRVIYTAKLNGFTNNIIKERVREAYV